MAKFTKVLKWAEQNGYEVKESLFKRGFVIKVNEDVSFTIEQKESTIYTSIRGKKGRAAGIYLTKKTPNFKGLCLQVSSQADALERMEDAINQYNNQRGL